MLKIVIIDDEPGARNLLAELVRKTGIPASLQTAASPLEGISLIREFQPDLVFLDIQMPRMNGFEMLEVLGERNFELVFVTAFSEYAIRAIRFAAFDYLTKPVKPEEVADVLKRLEQKTNTHSKERYEELLQQLQTPAIPGRMVIREMDQIHFISTSDIVYLSAEGAYSVFHIAGNEKITVSQNLSKYDELLSPAGFYRVHHSYLINIAHVKKFIKSSGILIMSNGAEVEVSTRKRADFLRIIDSL